MDPLQPKEKVSSSTTPEDAADPIDKRGPRERILEASLKLFVDQGYFNTNVPDISKASRCSVGSIYHHFLNKEEIAEHLYREGIAQFREALSQAIKADTGLEKTVQHIVVAFLRFVEDHRELSRYLWLARHNEFLSQKIMQPTMVGFDKLGRQLTSAIKSAIRQGVIPALHAEIIWSIIFGIPLSFTRDWFDGYTRETPTQVAPVIAKACWAALQGAR